MQLPEQQQLLVNDTVRLLHATTAHHDTTTANVLKHAHVKRFVGDFVRAYVCASPKRVRELVAQGKDVLSKARDDTCDVNKLDMRCHTLAKQLHAFHVHHSVMVAHAQNQLVDVLTTQHALLPLPKGLRSNVLPLDDTRTFTSGTHTRTETFQRRVHVRYLDDEDIQIAVGYTADTLLASPSIRVNTRLPLHVLGTVKRPAHGVPYVLTNALHTPCLYTPDDVHAMRVALGVAAPAVPPAASPAPRPAPHIDTVALRAEFPEIRDMQRIAQFYNTYADQDSSTRKRKLRTLNEAFACEVTGREVTNFKAGANYDYAKRLRKWLRDEGNKYRNAVKAA